MVKRRWVREGDEPSILDKRFRKARASQPRILDRSRMSALPAIVIADLRNGNIRSLDKYLRTHGGIPHREVAVELRKLLTGSSERTRYRLIAIEHPAKPAAKPGPPPAQGPRKPTDFDLELVAAFDRALPIERGKKGRAEETAAKASGSSISSVQRARRVVKEWEQAQAGRWTLTPDEIDRGMIALRGPAGSR